MEIFNETIRIDIRNKAYRLLPNAYRYTINRGYKYTINPGYKAYKYTINRINNIKQLLRYGINNNHATKVQPQNPTDSDTAQHAGNKKQYRKIKNTNRIRSTRRKYLRKTKKINITLIPSKNNIFKNKI